MKKYKTVEVMTSKGPRLLQYMYGERSASADQPINTCEADCQYFKVCRLLPDPENLDAYDRYRFCDFCGRKGDLAQTEEDREIRKMVPVPGCLENELGDVMPKILEVVKEKNPLVYLSDVIDSVCEFQCDMYDPQHSQCGAGNSMCLLQDLFIKAKCKNDPTQPCRRLDTDRDVTGESEKSL